MLFQSFEFLLFLPTVVIVYFLIPLRFRWIWLLAGSYFFYAYWNPYYIGLILASTLTDYWVALQLEKREEEWKRKILLGASLFINLGLLALFKYFDFASAQIEMIGRQFDPGFQSIYFNLVLPIGISFYTFQTLGYTIDVYRRKIKAERHIGKFALYVSFFPQLIAGPIERAQDLLSQFHFSYSFEYTRVVLGLRLILWGLFKKLVVADRIGLYVHEVFDFPDLHQGPIIWVAAGLFFLQVYYDFSAYQDIAVGAARLLGIRLSENFVNKAYAARSFTQFWQGWHMTLTRWVRDYVYFPLGGSKKGDLRTYWNIFIIMFIIGLWHGAGLTFIAWGTLNGVFIVVERYGRDRKLLAGLPENFWTNNLKYFLFFSLFSFTLIFFRSSSLTVSLQMIEQSFDFSRIYFRPDMFFIDFYLIIGLVVGLDLFMNLLKGTSFEYFLGERPVWIRWGVYIFFTAAILFLRIPEEIQFIYFEF